MRSAAVDHPAVGPDLPVCPRERADAAHADHGRHEALEEGALAAGEAVDDGDGGGATGGDERLVRLEEPLVVLQVGEVIVVEGVRGGGVEVVQGGGAAALGLRLPTTIRPPGCATP